MYTIARTAEFDRWLKTLRDRKAQARGETVYLLLASGDKSTQAADIKRAQKMLSELK